MSEGYLIDEINSVLQKMLEDFIDFDKAFLFDSEFVVFGDVEFKKDVGDFKKGEKIEAINFYFENLQLRTPLEIDGITYMDEIGKSAELKLIEDKQ
jgi:hypothetical protein